MEVEDVKTFTYEGKDTMIKFDNDKIPNCPKKFKTQLRMKDGSVIDAPPKWRRKIWAWWYDLRKDEIKTNVMLQVSDGLWEGHKINEKEMKIFKEQYRKAGTVQEKLQCALNFYAASKEEQYKKAEADMQSKSMQIHHFSHAIAIENFEWVLIDLAQCDDNQNDGINLRNIENKNGKVKKYGE